MWWRAVGVVTSCLSITIRLLRALMSHDLQGFLSPSLIQAWLSSSSSWLIALPLVCLILCVVSSVSVCLWVGLSDTQWDYDRLSAGTLAASRAACIEFSQLVGLRYLNFYLCCVCVCFYQYISYQQINKHFSFPLLSWLWLVRDRRIEAHSTWQTGYQELPLSFGFTSFAELQHDTPGLREVASHQEQVPIRWESSRC